MFAKKLMMVVAVVLLCLAAALIPSSSVRSELTKTVSSIIGTNNIII